MCRRTVGVASVLVESPREPTGSLGDLDSALEWEVWLLSPKMPAGLIPFERRDRAFGGAIRVWGGGASLDWQLAGESWIQDPLRPASCLR